MDAGQIDLRPLADQVTAAAMEAAGIRSLVLNAQYVKQVCGRKTDVWDSVCLVSLLS